MYLDLRLRKRNFGLGIGAIFLVSLALSLMQRTTNVQHEPRLLAKCRKLEGFFETRKLFKKNTLFQLTAIDDEVARAIEKSPVQGEDRQILAHLLLSQECPWQPSAPAVAWYRSELGECCNASFRLAITKENAPLGSDILLDGSKGEKLLVTKELMDLMPERSPFSGRLYDLCAVVGNGGILRNSSCGKEIDRADLIVRFNMPPMNYSEDVGTKTSLVTINPSIIEEKFQKLEGHRKPFADALRPYRDALFFIPAFSYVGHSELASQILYAMEDFGMREQAYFMNPHYLEALRTYWEEQGFRPPRLSSGFMLVSTAFELCKRITLYGFWPFSRDLDNQPILHHYYDDQLPKPGIHTMNREFSRYLKMYAQGELRLRLGKCQ